MYRPYYQYPDYSQFDQHPCYYCIHKVHDTHTHTEVQDRVDVTLHHRYVKQQGSSIIDN